MKKITEIINAATVAAREMEITFKINSDQTKSGKDKEGNLYHISANGEICTCVLKDGRSASDWMPEGAYLAAKSQPVKIDKDLVIRVFFEEADIDLSASNDSEIEEFLRDSIGGYYKIRRMF